MMKFLFALLAAVFAAPIANVSVKAITSGSGQGSIEVVAGDDEWSYQWEELTDDVKNTVRTQLSSMGIDGGFNESGVFEYNMPDFNFSQITSQQLSGQPATGNEPETKSNNRSNTYTSKVTISDGQDFQAIIAEQQQKMLEWVKENAASFYDALKAQMESLNGN